MCEQRWTNIIDLWGGYTDEHKTTDWTRDTLVPVWSASKLVINLAALMLVDRGLLDLDANDLAYLPEFAANGKEDIKVRHILSHKAGLSVWEGPVTAADIYGREAATAKLAEQAPWWEPGTASGYHIVSQGHLVGELVRRAKGVDLVVGFPLRWGIGYALPWAESAPWISYGKVCFWGRWGGSIVIVDLTRRLTISYAMKRMGTGVVGTDRTEA
ncbi:hypothetical protein HFD88_010579 [Aspergillus terreus]|nr:hypothetical protein HFD88_010579 [Aspergillus terreus]